jgi:hypothetical protein
VLGRPRRSVLALGAYSSLLKMWQRLPIIGALLSCLCLSGCVGPVPGKWATSPEVRGRVIDGTTGEPVVGATVAIQGRLETAVVTDTAGRFHIAAVREFAFRTFTSCPVYDCPKTKDYCAQVEIKHPSYETLRLFAFSHLAKPENHTAGPLFLTDLSLVPKPK